MNLSRYMKKFKKISFIYIDCNVYQVVEKILNETNKKLQKGVLLLLTKLETNLIKMKVKL